MSPVLRMLVVRATQVPPGSRRVSHVPAVCHNMESFSFLTISGPRISSSVLSTFPDLVSSRDTSLPDIAKTTFPMEASGLAPFLPLQHPNSALRHGVVLTPDYVLGDPQNGELPRRNCTIYRPWFSPYSYFVCMDKETHLGAYSFPELPRDEGRGDGGLPEEAANSLCSSSSSLDNSCPREATKKSRHGPEAPDHITSQDILRASRWLPAQQHGFKCAACCRMFPTLCSLKSHIQGGFREGFSCHVFYRKLKTLWARPADRLPVGGYQARK
ncbi:spermatogenesis-associated protein 46 [Saccopteryx leptura]|uniref:spermatogenesis-associated protein 46 n=1 Tax=Saccopteryx leptura TaxID=249018 RepID=UPI00339D18BF